MAAPVSLTIAVDRTPLTEALFNGAVASDRIRLDFVEVKPITRAFRRMARALEFDACEMALATQAVAYAYGKPFRVLPAPLLREVPHRRLMCPAGSSLAGPADLAGKRIAVRAYAQTTVVWWRGILADEFGVDPDSITWLSQEDSHVAEVPLQANEQRVAADLTLAEMLEDGMADAAITLHLGNNARIRTVVPDAEAAGRAWAERLGIQPINHVPAVRNALLDAHPWLAGELTRLFEAARRASTPDGHDPVPWNEAGAALLLRYAARQRLTPTLYTPSDLLARLA